MTFAKPNDARFICVPIIAEDDGTPSLYDQRIAEVRAQLEIPDDEDGALRT